MPDEYQLEKSVWTEEDFERTGWHDVTVHAFAYEPDLSEFVLDLDYILKWIRPDENETRLSFWSAPATLVFENVSGLAIELSPFPGFEISDIDRVDTRPAEGDERVIAGFEWQWTLGFFEGQISFRSTGHTQYIRCAPRINATQSFTLEERGGISFARPAES